MGPRLLLLLMLPVACANPDEHGVTLTVAASGVGDEGKVLLQQVDQFTRQSGGVKVNVLAVPDAADQRHQLYVQWLNARVNQPDLLQVDVIWTPEFAAAGWIAPFEDATVDEDFFPSVQLANRWQGRTYALPLFVDVGMLYWRTDLMPAPPTTWYELILISQRLMRDGRVPYGFAWQGARYEGLVTVFMEMLGGLGGSILDEQGQVTVDGPAGARSLQLMQRLLAEGITPRSVLTWQEEQARFAFQNGLAAFMRNWPYAYPLLQDPRTSKVTGRVKVAPMPADGGRPTATLGGAQIAVNAHSRHLPQAQALARFLAAPDQVVQRARLAGQYPARPSLYRNGALEGILPIPPADAYRVISAAAPRPVTPVYTELSEKLQIHLHRALAERLDPVPVILEADRAMEKVLENAHGGTPRSPERQTAWWWLIGLACIALVAMTRLRKRAAPRRDDAAWMREEQRQAWWLVTPAVVLMALVALIPLGWTFWESLHRHDLRMPWLPSAWVGLANYADMFRAPRFWQALGHTAFFTVTTVVLEVVLGMVVALAVNPVVRARAAVRTCMLLPWAIPTVMAAIIWRFMFDNQAGIMARTLSSTGLVQPDFVWFADAAWAWVPVILVDVWKTTPFVALLLLAGMQGIDPALYESAQLDGASARVQFTRITLPLLKPTLLVVLLFRTLDAFRVFDLVYVLTGGGPGTATEPLALLTFTELLQNLRFGYGSALAVVVFLVGFFLALSFIRVVGADIHKDGA